MGVLHALVVPGVIAAASIAYWLQIAGARRAVVFVPSGTLVLIAVLLAAVVFIELRSRASQDVPFDPSSGRRSVGLLVLSIAYFFIFTELGFSAANLLFIFGASVLMDLPLRKAAASALIMTLVLFGLAHAMDFQLPEPFWSRT